MKNPGLGEDRHSILSPLASVMAQLELIKRSDEFDTFSPEMKERIEKLIQKLTEHTVRLKEHFTNQ